MFRKTDSSKYSQWPRWSKKQFNSDSETIREDDILGRERGEGASVLKLVHSMLKGCRGNYIGLVSGQIFDWLIARRRVYI